MLTCSYSSVDFVKNEVFVKRQQSIRTVNLQFHSHTFTVTMEQESGSSSYSSQYYQYSERGSFLKSLKECLYLLLLLQYQAGATASNICSCSYLQLQVVEIGNNQAKAVIIIISVRGCCFLLKQCLCVRSSAATSSSNCSYHASAAAPGGYDDGASHQHSIQYVLTKFTRTLYSSILQQ